MPGTRGIWPRPAPDAQDGGRKQSVIRESPGLPPKDTGGHPPPRPASGSVTAEGVLRDALVQLWEQARAQRMEKIGVLSIRMFEAGDAFRLLGAIGAVSGATKVVTIAGGYETREGGSFELEFTGSVADAQPVKEFLDPQLRDANSQNLEVGFAMTFEDGLSMQGEAAEKLTERLARFASGAAYVSATAEAAA